MSFYATPTVAFSRAAAVELLRGSLSAGIARPWRRRLDAVLGGYRYALNLFFTSEAASSL